MVKLIPPLCEFQRDRILRHCLVAVSIACRNALDCCITSCCGSGSVLKVCHCLARS
jgi:hypothetical protein